ncbi:MAG: GTPase Era [Rhodospirillaceae bacterium]
MIAKLTHPSEHDATRCGFIALAGAPNAGKSTLLNTLVGQKLSIVSPRVQTTRRRVLGIAMSGKSQLIFVDTPGIFMPSKRLERAMVASAWQGVGDADLVVVLADAASGKIDKDTEALINRLKGEQRQAILAINKIDLIRRDRLLALSERLNRDGVFTETLMISALTGDGVGDLKTMLARLVPPGPWHFPEDQVSDMPMRLLAADMTREKVFLQLYQELPYSTTVETETWEEMADGSARICQVIFVERESQRAIVIGKGGQRIRALGETSRLELEEMLERRIHLKLFVKVREHWTDDPERYREMGLDFPA